MFHYTPVTIQFKSDKDLQVACHIHLKNIEQTLRVMTTQPEALRQAELELKSLTALASNMRYVAECSKNGVKPMWANPDGSMNAARPTEEEKQ